MECDKDFGLINQKMPAEMPSDWIEQFKSARTKPTPFEVIVVEQHFFRNWTDFLRPDIRNNVRFPLDRLEKLRLAGNIHGWYTIETPLTAYGILAL